MAPLPSPPVYAYVLTSNVYERHVTGSNELASVKTWIGKLTRSEYKSVFGASCYEMPVTSFSTRFTALAKLK